MISYKNLNKELQVRYWQIIRSDKNDITEDWAEDALNQKSAEYWNEYGLGLFFVDTFKVQVNNWRLNNIKRIKLVEDYWNKHYGDLEVKRRMDQYFDRYWWNQEYKPPVEQQEEKDCLNCETIEEFNSFWYHN